MDASSPVMAAVDRQPDWGWESRRPVWSKASSRPRDERVLLKPQILQKKKKKKNALRVLLSLDKKDRNKAAATHPRWS